MPKLNRKQVLINAGDAVARLPEITLRAAKVAEGLITGPHGRRKKGQGDDFWQFRTFDPQSDNVGRIDWRRSAKGDTLHVREKEDMRPHVFQFWLDPSETMFYTGDPSRSTKFEYGLTLATILAMLFIKAGEKVAVAGHDLVISQMNQIEQFQNALLSATNFDVVSAKPHCDTILITDGLNIDKQHLNRLALAKEGKHSTLSFFRIFDSTEAVFDFEGHIKFTGSSRSYDLETQNARALQNEYLSEYQTHIDEINKAVKKEAVYPMDTGQAFEKALMPYLSDMIDQ